ncbi:prolipoprotein diacylglyceryl transferase [Marinibactrum halimedae]|uniref:Phosphatidylglycerol--prolipoprotein diacylglyceryl transferase n=1 Tax=Marinibactrum halimedae TaxID=1444977 RepID=A0AA37T3V2_9GAMM|nr:prolipoprotein diacylglyceryl transferase [Marinibactrum halimedae]GLS25329.1 prolipoprotein diacylglyceryl transferase [Marinibactrum halimedae]
MQYPAIDPVAFSLGPLTVHWYGIMYLLGFAAAWLLAMHRAAKPWSPVTRAQVEDLIMWSAFGVVLGGRLGYVFFYQFERFLEDPLWLFRIWEGGMAFHGGMLGVILAIFLYSLKINVRFLRLMDFVAPLVPLGLGFGRIGNFIGQELWGRQTDVSWAMVFPKDPEQLARHPSQLYQATLEGLALFLILLWYSRKPRAAGTVGALFLIFYGSFRFLVEFFREPDSHIGFDLMGWMTRGQLLSTPMILAGLVLFVVFWWRESRAAKQEIPTKKPVQAEATE